MKHRVLNQVLRVTWVGALIILAACAVVFALVGDWPDAAVALCIAATVALVNWVIWRLGSSPTP